MQESSRAGTFSGRVVVLFGTQVFGAGIGIFNGILLARLLGPAAKGDYYLLILVPSTVMVLIQLGLPQAFAFFAARGRTAGHRRQGIRPDGGPLPRLRSSRCWCSSRLLRRRSSTGSGLAQVLIAFVALPLALNATFTTGIVMGRQAVRWYAAVNIVVPDRDDRAARRHPRWALGRP